jgi:hypothetical protein
MPTQGIFCFLDISQARRHRSPNLSFIPATTNRMPAVDCVWNVMAHAQKTDFVFLRNGRVHLNRWGASVQSTTGSRGVRISGRNAGYTMFEGNVKSTGYPLHSPVSPSISLPYVTVCHHISTGFYLDWTELFAKKSKNCLPSRGRVLYFGSSPLPVISSFICDSL